MGEKVKFLYNHQTEYQADDKNVIGATTDKILRTITAPAAATTNYVRKFGKAYAIADITNAVISTPRSDGGGANKWWFEFYNQNDTLLATVKDELGASTFVDGTAEASTLVYIKLVWKAGTVAITDGDTINLTTDVDAPLVVNLSGESIATGSLVWHLAESGSTYYQSDSTDLTNIENYMWGGKRHTPVAGSEKYPYFHPVDADTALGARVIVHVLDSKYYQIDEYAIANVNTIWQAALGETPHLISVIGASEYRDVEHDGNNSDTVYVSKTGVDGAPNTGSFQLPYLTHSHAFTNRGARSFANTADSGTFNESFTISANFTLEPIYSKIPIITYGSVVTANFTLTAATINICGYEIDGNNVVTYGIRNQGIAFNGNIKDVFVYNCISFGISLNISAASSGNLYNCKCNNNNVGIVIDAPGANTFSGNIKKCICYNNSSYGIYIDYHSTFTGIMQNNICYNNGSGIVCSNAPVSGNIQNNTCYNNSSYGISFFAVTWTGIIRNNICYNNSNYDLSRVGGTAVVTITNTNYLTNSGFTIGAGCITSDPQFCSLSSPYKLGIKGSSGACHTDSASNNMGVFTYSLILAANSITINGFIFDGLDSYVHAIYQNATRTGCKIKWNTTQNYQGISIDNYGTVDTLNEIENNKMKNNGDGLRITTNSKVVKENCIYKNNGNGITTIQKCEINHNVMFNNGTGIYNKSGTAIFKNLTIYENSGYGIYSLVSMSITYCCITDATTSNVNYTHISNIIISPLFINTTDGNEDFHIKTIEGGYKLESPCKQAADDGYDMGAYLVDYVILQDSWEKYTVEFNPRTMNELYKRKGGLSFEDGKGNYSGYSKARRLRLPMVWAGNSATSKNQRLMLRHFSEREMGRESEYTAAESEFRVSVLPIKYYGQGTSAIDAAAKTITDNTKSWLPNEKKGFHCSVIYDSKLAGNVNAAAKTVTKAGAGWTIDEWAGYYFPYDGWYWYILSNTATILTLSDPNGDLTDNANFDFNITKQFKIQKSSKKVLTLRDDDSELIDGSYDYYIDYILCNVIGSDFGYNQAVYDYEKDKTKSGYKLTYEEID